MNTNAFSPNGAPRRLALLTLGIALAIGLGGCRDDAYSGVETSVSPVADLFESAERGDVSALDALLGQSGNPNTRDECRWTPLMKAALNGHRDAVARLLAAGAEVDAADKGGYTALMLAASNNHADVVGLLLDHGASIDAAERTEGYTALAWAAQRGHLASVQALLARGANRTLPDLKGQTPAMLAQAGGHGAVVAALGTQAPAVPSAR